MLGTVRGMKTRGHGPSSPAASSRCAVGFQLLLSAQGVASWNVLLFLTFYLSSSPSPSQLQRAACGNHSHHCSKATSSAAEESTVWPEASRTETEREGKSYRTNHNSPASGPLLGLLCQPGHYLEISTQLLASRQVFAYVLLSYQCPLYVI